MGRDDILTPREVEGLIADGAAIVVFDDYVLNLSHWLQKHPGGQLAIQHMVGRDATDEIKIYHAEDTLRRMKAFRIGRKPVGVWPNMTPPIRGGVYRKADHVVAVSPSPTRDADKPDLAVEDVETDSAGSDDDADSVSRLDRSPSPAASSVDGGSLASSITSVSAVSGDEDLQAAAAAADCDEKEGDEGLRLRQRAVPSGQPGLKPKADPFRHLSPDEYTEWAMRQDEERDARDYPPVETAVQQEIARKYRELHQRVIDEGYYDCPYLDYGKECARYLTLFGTFLFLLRHEWYVLSAVSLGLFWQQIMFSAHDAGHCAITHNFKIDTLIALFIADFCCGLSMGWWKSSHNVHHLITNMPEHDPDIQNLPLFATCPSFFKSIKSSYYNGFVFVWDKASELLVPWQKYTYYPIMGIARFNLYLLSWLHILSSKSSGLYTTSCWWIRPTEIAFMCCYWFLFGYCLVWRSLPTWTIRVVFVVVSHIAIMPLHIQITLSHWGMATTNLGEEESFPQRQLRTTMDVDCPAWMDFVHGGLQFQVIHHLFPRVPRHNLRKVQALVKDFCRDTGIPYSILGFVKSNKKVLGRLETIGEQVTMMVNCHKYMVETGESGLH